MIRYGVRVMLVLALLVSLGTMGWLTRDYWLPKSATSEDEVAVDDEHDHEHGSEGGTESIVLSEQARKNLGLKTGPVVVGEFWSSMSVPATVVEQPGHSHRKVASPLTGMVKQLFVHPSQLVRPGEPIAELELSGDALATTQSDLLQVIRELEVNQSELNRVENLVKEGSLPEKNQLQLEYDRRRLQTQRESKVQQLIVLGLSAEQVKNIEESRQLIRSFVIRTPEVASEIKAHQVFPNRIQQASGTLAEEKDPPKPDWSYTVESLDVFPGKRVQIGDELCSLAFHAILFLEGQAFEKETGIISRAMEQAWPLTARFETDQENVLRKQDLKILFVDNVIDQANRTFRFFIALQNEVLLDNPGPTGELYRTWRFKPGQKAELDVPTQKLVDVIVLPSDAVVKDGLDSFVFIANGKRFDRRSVEVKSIVKGTVVVVNDGSLFPGDTIALNNAYQLNLAIKKASGQGGGGHDHSGHNHAH
ncbi:efflux RND transporter periplasmic adaptor subunit [bacterium]|nr:efflux RND transporter periplasmic adaptor subunit [bacterium]